MKKIWHPYGMPEQLRNINNKMCQFCEISNLFFNKNKKSRTFYESSTFRLSKITKL